MKITVSCMTCGKIIAVAEKDDVSQADLDMYVVQSACDTDGPFPPVMGVDDNGDPIVLVPAVANTIVATKTVS